MRELPAKSRPKKVANMAEAKAMEGGCMKTTTKVARLVGPIGYAFITASTAAMAAGPTVRVDWTKALRAVVPGRVA